MGRTHTKKKKNDARGARRKKQKMAAQRCPARSSTGTIWYTALASWRCSGLLARTVGLLLPACVPALHSPRTSHLAPRTSHRAPRTAHHAPRTAHRACRWRLGECSSCHPPSCLAAGVPTPHRQRVRRTRPATSSETPNALPESTDEEARIKTRAHFRSQRTEDQETGARFRSVGRGTDGPEDGRTDRRTDGRTGGRTDERTDEEDPTNEQNGVRLITALMEVPGTYQCTCSEK